MKLSDKYYSGRDVQRLLGISEPQLRTLVSNKKLKKVTPPGRKTSVYLKAEVNAYAEQWEAFLMAKEPPKTTFELPELEDMEEENELDRKTVGGAGMSADVRRAWLAANHALDYHVRHNGKLVAFLRMLPLKKEVIESFMRGEVRGKDIPASAIETFEPGKHIECLIIGISSDPDVDENTRSHYVLRLIREAARNFEELGRNGVIIDRIYATSESPTGIAMALHIGMHEQPPKLGKRIRFVMDIDNADSFLAARYKQGLNEWKKRQSKPTSDKKRKTALKEEV